MFTERFGGCDVTHRQGYKQPSGGDTHRLLFGASISPVNVDMLLKGT